jgi:hypothetical protein
MCRVLVIFPLFLLSVAATAQVVFKTIVTKGPVAVGESFPVQFVLEDIDPGSEFYQPDFRDFRLVNGPYIYSGSVQGPDGPTKLKNIMFTLEAIKPGKFLIAGAGARVNDNYFKSDNVWVEVIPRSEAIKRGQYDQNLNADYFLKPGEDPYKKIRDNLFLKIMVDKTTCFTGEPVTATYKLYSRLISKSAIVKNPGFYGFTVHDMVGLGDKKSEIEMVGGKKFDVHTIRKVQLYPLRPGQFTIDPMELSNKVEFSRTVVTRKTEQEIIEGVVAEKDEPAALNAAEYESDMRTEPVLITVKPSPENRQPDDFTGATGRFEINAVVDKKELAKNEEGKLVIEVSGKGNFTQLTAPVIEWPSELEGFEPKITDTLDHSLSPLKGKRSFVFSFVSAKPGHYSIPSVRFSFFDPDSNRYKTVTTQPLNITINDNQKVAEQAPEAGDNSGGPDRYHEYFIMLILLAAMGVCIGWYKLRSKKPAQSELAAEQGLPSVTALLGPAAEFSGEDKLFYTTLRQCIWNFFTLHFGLTGSKMNNYNVRSLMQQQQADEATQLNVLEILEECETGMFTTAYIQTDRKALLKKTEENLKKLV